MGGGRAWEEGNRAVQPGRGGPPLQGEVLGKSQKAEAKTRAPGGKREGVDSSRSALPRAPGS